MIQTKSAPRRDLSFHCTGCLRAELDRIEAAERSGALAHTGNWSPGENLDHVARVWEYSLDGFPDGMKSNFVVRLMAGLMRKSFTSGKTLPAGFNYGKMGAYMAPRPGCTVQEGLARLRRVIDRLDRGEQMTHASPAFGTLSHDEWMRLHLGHAQLHLGFIAY
jgi:hypothetical protein